MPEQQEAQRKLEFWTDFEKIFDSATSELVMNMHSFGINEDGAVAMENDTFEGVSKE